jgi:hypothetical protein
LNKLARLGLSFVGGIAITFFLVLLGMLLTYRNIGNWLFATLLYWPSDVMSRTGIGPDCANADLVSEKLDCIALSFGVDVIIYSLLVLLALTLFRRKVRFVKLNHPKPHLTPVADMLYIAAVMLTEQSILLIEGFNGFVKSMKDISSSTILTNGFSPLFAEVTSTLVACPTCACI